VLLGWTNLGLQLAAFKDPSALHFSGNCCHLWRWASECNCNWSEEEEEEVEVGMMTDLEALMLYDNTLTGSLPSQVGWMTPLLGLLFMSNALTGSIPSEVMLLSLLQDIMLQDNAFLWNHSKWIWFNRHRGPTISPFQQFFWEYA